MLRYTSAVQFLLCCVLFAGCPQPSETTNGTEPDTSGQGHAHTHEGDDMLVWQREGLEHEGYIISLGHFGKTLFADHDVEPVGMIKKDDTDVTDAKVYVALVGEEVTEQATVYESENDDEPAHYAQAELRLPADATEATLRYRIELPDASEFTQDVTVDVEKH